MQNKTIQFNINSDDNDTPGISALRKASKIANKYNISDMSQDEINVEIAESRKSSDWYHFDINLIFIHIWSNKKRTATIRNWTQVYGELSIMYEGQLPE